MGVDEEAERHVRHSRELLAHDRLSELASKTRSNIDIGHHIIAGKLADGDDEHDRLSVGSLESEIDQDLSERPRQEDFVQVDGLSAALRRTAAPHIYNIYDQIFMEDEAGKRSSRTVVPDLPAEIVRDSGGSWGEHARVALVLEGLSSSDTMLRSQVAADVAKTLGVSRESVSVGHSHSAHEGLHLDIVLRSNRGGGGHGPQCGELAAELVKQACELGSTLRAMPATRRAISAVIREVNAPGSASVAQYASMRDGRGSTRPGLTGVGGMEDGGWSYDPRGVKALSKALGEQEKEMQRVRQAASARRNRDGFWVDVEEGKHKSAMAPHSVVHHQMRPTAAYGTLVVPEKKEGMPAWLRTFFYLGAVAFCLMLIWVVYLKYYYGKV